MEDFDKYYEILGLTPDATEDEIKKAFRDLSLVWHPDRFRNNPRLAKKAEEKIKEINIAYKKLKTSYFDVHNIYTTETAHDKTNSSKVNNQSSRSSITYNYYAIAGFIIGCLSLMIIWISPLGILFSSIGLIRLHDYNDNNLGEKCGKIGLFTSIMGMIMLLFWIQ